VKGKVALKGWHILPEYERKIVKKFEEIDI
jgi:hypothetical protein